MVNILYSLVYVLLCVCSVKEVTSKQCKKINNCICDFDDGSGMIDLTPLGKTDGTPLFLDQSSAVDLFLYSYNPCGAFTESTCVNVAACQYSTYYLTGYDIGVPDKVNFEYDGTNVVANYLSQDGSRQSFVTLVCKEDAVTPQLDVTGESTVTEYYMSLSSIAACPVPSKYGSNSGISAGSVMLIIFFTLLVVYFAAGLVFNKYKREASGKDMIPNLNFWTTLPGLIRDGVLFTKGKILRRSEYEQK